MSYKDASGSQRLLWGWTAVLAIGLVGGGCSSMGDLLPSGRLPYQKLSALYFQVPLQQSNPLDILRRMKEAQGSVDPKSIEREIVTQSATVIALSGRAKHGGKSWFTLVAFDKYSNMALSKYFFYLDENAGASPIAPKRYLIPARTVLVYDTQAQIADVLASPHASEEQRKIAVVQYLAQQLQRDLKQLNTENGSQQNTDIVGVNGMFMNQVFRDALNELKRYPVLTRQLDGPEGVKFENMNLTSGRLHLRIEGNYATARIELGIRD